MEQKESTWDSFKKGFSEARQAKIDKIVHESQLKDKLSMQLANQIFATCSEKCIRTFTTKTLDRDEISCLKECAYNIEQFNSVFNTCSPFGLFKMYPK